MAKQKDAAYNQFLADLVAINPQFEELVKDERVSTRLREGVLARADYSSNMDSLRNEREQFANEVQEARQRIAGWQDWYGQATTEVATVQSKLQQYEQLYGPIETAGEQRRAAQHLGVSKDELNDLMENRMNQRDIAALKFADDLTDIKIDYRDRFKEKLDTAAVYDIAGKRGVDLTTAYNLHIAERVAEQNAKAVDERIKQEREDAVREYASKHNLPVVPTQSDMVHVLDAKDVPTDSRSRIAAAVAAVNAGRGR